MTPTARQPTAGEEVSRLAERLFREQAGRLVALLTGIFGVHRLQLAEDVVQEALIRALKTWPYYGIPDNPTGWLMKTARNHAIDLIRREKRFRDKEEGIIADLTERMSPMEIGRESSPQFEEEIRDARLRMMFACCHPLLPLEMQTALALKVLGGLSPKEIASAFLVGEAAIAKRLTRARRKLQYGKVRFEIPVGLDLEPRLEGVLQTLYLLFNEGYKATGGPRAVREELCFEAIRLATLLAGHPVVGRPGAHALLALMLLNAARLPSRTDREGNLLRLEEQDRSLWDTGMIQRGIQHLARGSGGEVLSEYHLQAAISACHCLARDESSTDWPRILSLYDHLVEMNDSPVIALNRAVAVGRVYGPEAGIGEVERLLTETGLETYYLTHAVLGDFAERRQYAEDATLHFERALTLTDLEPEKAFLQRRLQRMRRADPRSFLNPSKR